MNRVVITGIGALSPLGNTFRACWEAAKAGLSGIAPITRFDASHIPWKVAGELKGFDASSYLGRKERTRLALFIQNAVAASLMAVEDAGLSDGNTDFDPALSEGGVIIGSSRGAIDELDSAIRKNVSTGSRLSAYLMPSTTIGMAPAYVAQRLGSRGYCLGISNACASGANAIGEAYRLIKNGFKGPVLAGGTEAPVCRVSIEGFGASGVLSRRSDASASRPFDRLRDGFVLAEGACVMVLEEEMSAIKRGAHIYGEIAGYGNTVDAFHQTRPDKDGEIRAMRAAIEEAGLSEGDIDSVNAHATSTRLGDSAEAQAITELLGERASEVPVSAVKSMTGHMLAASAAIEIAYAVMSVREGVVLPTTNLIEKDPECALALFTEAKAKAVSTALSNSFGFGGVNAVLVVRRYGHSLSNHH
jgi:3-oxoacyl-(acyl-carrier-protein) synthase